MRPDQNEWLSLWMSHLAGDSLRKLLQRLRFTESLEMLSVYACIMNDSAVAAYPLEQIKKHADEIGKARRQMHKRHGREASPVLVLKSVMDTL